MIRSTRRFAFFLLVFGSFAGTPPFSIFTVNATLQAAEQPNILFIFADDQCFETIRSLNNDEIETPNLDRLVKRGTTFSRTYNMGSWSGAVCVASRTMLNTGRYLWYAHEIYDNSEQERTQGRFWSEHLKKAGYKTYMTGKWHVRASAEKAFDVTKDIRGGMPNQTPEGYNRPHEGKEDAWSPSDAKFDGYWKGGKHWSEVVGDNGVEFLSTAAANDDPFFMYLAFNAPHDPRQSPQSFVDRYPQEKICIPANFIPEYPFKDAIGCGQGLRDERLAPFPRTEYSVRVNRQEYYAIITHMDEQVGRILDALAKSGKAENTYIFFTADHGLAVGQHGLIGKQNMYDHSVRVPFIAVGPDVEAGRVVDAPIYLQDVMPTTLELAGVEKPDHVQFHSLLPLLRGGTKSHLDAIYGAYLQVQRAVTMGSHKLILYPAISKARLYNVDRDPLEMLDLAVSDASSPLMKKLFARLLDLQTEVGDKLDLKTPFASLVADDAQPTAVVAAPANPAPGKQVEQNIKLPSGESVSFLFSLPEDYEAKEKHPLMLFLHGRGESFGPLSIVAKWGPPRFVARGDKMPYILVSPQCPKEERWSQEKQQKILIELLDHVQNNFKVDTDRVYLTGLSMGGYGSWTLAAAHANRFAAAAMVCGGGEPDDADRLVNLPIWVFHGDQDKAVPIERSTEMVNAIINAGGKKIRFTTLENIGHNSWSAAYATPELFEWFDSHSLKKEIK